MNRLLTTLLLLCFATTSILAQKVIIYFDDNLSTTPSVSKAALKYNKDFAYSFTFDDATNDAYTHALPVFQGGKVQNTMYPTLFFTDGCGNDIPFKAGIAWNSANAAGIDVHTGEVKDLLTWKQLDTLYDFGWDVLNHSYSHKSKWFANMSRADYTNEILKNQTEVKAKTRKKIEMPAFVVPAGDDGYQNMALELGNKIVFDQTAGVIGYGGLAVDGDINLYNQKVHRQLLEESLTSFNFLDKAATKSTVTNHFWYNEFTHRVDQTTGAFNFEIFKNHIQRAANTWGKTGSDRMWMAPLQEVFEYLVLRQTVKYSTQIVGKTLEINFDVTQIPAWLRRKPLTLVVNSTVNFSRVDVPPTIGKTFKGTGINKIINLDFTNFTNPTPTKDMSTPSVFRLFPNPTGDILTIEPLFDMSEIVELSVVDVSGKTVKTARFKEKSYNLDVKTLSAGLYFISLKQGEHIYTDKFIKK